MTRPSALHDEQGGNVGKPPPCRNDNGRSQGVARESDNGRSQGATLCSDDGRSQGATGSECAITLMADVPRSEPPAKKVAIDAGLALRGRANHGRDPSQAMRSTRKLTWLSLGLVSS